MNDNILTLPTKEMISGRKKLKIIKEYGSSTKFSDLAELTGDAHCSYYTSSIGNSNLFKGPSKNIFTVYSNGNLVEDNLDDTYVIKPILKSTKIFSSVTLNNSNIVVYGHYPQEAVNYDTNLALEKAYNSYRLKKTGRTYTFYEGIFITSTSNYHGLPDNPIPRGHKKVVHDEYKYKDEYYICVKNQDTNTLVNGKAKYGNHYYEWEAPIWVKVEPVRWLVDKQSGLLLAQSGLLSGVPYTKNREPYDGNFENTNMYDFLNTYMLKDMTQELPLKDYNQDIEESKEEIYVPEYKSNKVKLNDLYNFKSLDVSEEDIIKGAIESDIPVFLHGKSSDGKSARVKALDKDATIIYLRNATPESLNGKSVYDQSTGEMHDIKPTWLVKLEDKCNREPSKLHILFFDELSNSIPNIQKMAFNIVLDKEVNGLWKLPKNTRIVAAGNEMEDSLAANEIAEPLFNRFAHVYIKTTPAKWLKWARENHIHPAICTFIAYTNGKALRTKYDGEKPNADPRKWEMASKMLYKTGNPEMLRALVGEDITKEFIAFCTQKTISLEDVLNDNYTLEELESLDVSQCHATVLNLVNVDEKNVRKVRNFISKLNPELLAVFDVLWVNDNNERLEILAELKLEEKYGGKSL